MRNGGTAHKDMEAPRSINRAMPEDFLIAGFRLGFPDIDRLTANDKDRGLRNAIKLSGRTFLAPHRGSSPKGRGGYVAVLHESVEISIASDYSIGARYTASMLHLAALEMASHWILASLSS